MPCKCGGCDGGGGGTARGDAEVPTLATGPDVRSAVVEGACPGPGDRLARAVNAATSGDVASAASVFSEGSFGSVRCWPLWVWLAAALWLGWVRS